VLSPGSAFTVMLRELFFCVSPTCAQEATSDSECLIAVYRALFCKKTLVGGGGGGFCFELPEKSGNRSLWFCKENVDNYYLPSMCVCVSLCVCVCCCDFPPLGRVKKKKKLVMLYMTLYIACVTGLIKSALWLAGSSHESPAEPTSTHFIHMCTFSPHKNDLTCHCKSPTLAD